MAKYFLRFIKPFFQGPFYSEAMSGCQNKRSILKDSLSISQIHYESTFYFANSLSIRINDYKFTINYCELSQNTLDVTQIHYEMSLFLAYLLWIQSLSGKFTLNLLWISRIYFNFTMNSLGFSQINFGIAIFFTNSTSISRIYYEFTFFSADLS